MPEFVSRASYHALEKQVNNKRYKIYYDPIDSSLLIENQWEVINGQAWIKFSNGNPPKLLEHCIASFLYPNQIIQKVYHLNGNLLDNCRRNLWVLVEGSGGNYADP